MGTGLPLKYRFCAAVLLLVAFGRAFLPCSRLQKEKEELMKNALCKEMYFHKNIIFQQSVETKLFMDVHDIL